MSDTDDEITITRNRKIRKRNTTNRRFDSDGSDSDSNSDQNNGGNDDPKKIKMAEAEADSDESSEWESDWMSDSKKDSSNILDSSTASKLDYGSDSSTSSNGDSEKCPICLLSLNQQEIGSPEVCEHVFCAPCIEEWSKNVTTCPIDRKNFDAINIYDNILKKEFLRKVKVQVKSKGENVDPVPDDDLTSCEICRQPNNEETMLLCDSCNLGYHMECLSPPLTEIPTGSWYCDNCFASASSEEDDQEVNDLLNDLNEIGGLQESRLRMRMQATPRIVRTRQSERIRATILTRTSTSVRLNVPQDAGVPGPSRRAAASAAAAPRRRKKRRQRRRILKMIISEYDINNSDDKFASKKKKIFKKLRKLKRKKSKRRGRPGRSINHDLAHAGNFGNDDLQRQRFSTGIPTLSIMGRANELEYFPDSDDEINALRGSGTKPQTFGASFGQSSSQNFKNGFEPSGASTSQEPVDLLGSIMQSQERWHSRNGTKNIKIRSNGGLMFDSENDLRRTPRTPRTAAVTATSSRSITSPASASTPVIKADIGNNSTPASPLAFVVPPFHNLPSPETVVTSTHPTSTTSIPQDDNESSSASASIEVAPLLAFVAPTFPALSPLEPFSAATLSPLRPPQFDIGLLTSPGPSSPAPLSPDSLSGRPISPLKPPKFDIDLLSSRPSSPLKPPKFDIELLVSSGPSSPVPVSPSSLTARPVSPLKPPQFDIGLLSSLDVLASAPSSPTPSAVEDDSMLALTSPLKPPKFDIALLSAAPSSPASSAVEDDTVDDPILASTSPLKPPKFDIALLSALEPISVAPSSPAPSSPAPSSPAPSSIGALSPGPIPSADPASSAPSSPGPTSPGPSPPGLSSPGPLNPAPLSLEKISAVPLAVDLPQFTMMSPTSAGPSSPAPSSPEPDNESENETQETSSSQVLNLVAPKFDMAPSCSPAPSSPAPSPAPPSVADDDSQEQPSSAIVASAEPSQFDIEPLMPGDQPFFCPIEDFYMSEDRTATPPIPLPVGPPPTKSKKYPLIVFEDGGHTPPLQTYSKTGVQNEEEEDEEEGNTKSTKVNNWKLVENNEHCPNFSVYSSESLEFAKATDSIMFSVFQQRLPRRIPAKEEFGEKDVDLVQLEDDDEEQEGDEKEQEEPEVHEDHEEQEEEEEHEEQEAGVLENDENTDIEGEDEACDEEVANLVPIVAENAVQEQPQLVNNYNENDENRSYTPCLDEKYHERKDLSDEALDLLGLIKVNKNGEDEEGSMPLMTKSALKDKFLKKLNRQERVVDEVKLVIKPYYNRQQINKDEYKDVLRRAVPKICHSRTGEINPIKIQSLIKAYVKKIKQLRRINKKNNSTVI